MYIMCSDETWEVDNSALFIWYMHYLFSAFFIWQHFHLYFPHFLVFQVRKVFLLWLPWLLRMQRPGRPVTRRDLFRSTKVQEMELKEQRASRSLLDVPSEGNEDFRPSSSPAPLQRVPYANVSSCLHAEAELAAILRELKVITARLRKDDADAEVVSDWQFAAMVVDRICLINFTIFTVASTILSLGSAPHLVA